MASIPSSRRGPTTTKPAKPLGPSNRSAREHRHDPNPAAPFSYPQNILLRVTINAAAAVPTTTTTATTTHPGQRVNNLGRTGSQNGPDVDVALQMPRVLSRDNIECKVRRRLERACTHSVDYVLLLCNAGDGHSEHTEPEAERGSLEGRDSTAHLVAPSKSPKTMDCIVRTSNTSCALALLSAFHRSSDPTPSQPDPQRASTCPAASNTSVWIHSVRLLSQAEQAKHWSQVPARVRNRAILKARRQLKGPHYSEARSQQP